MTDIKDRRLNPYDPFDNPTENCAYRTDYRDIVPDIDKPGTELPLIPEKAETKRIRRYFNITGLSLLIGAVGLNLVFIILTAIAEFCMTGSFDPEDLFAAEDYIYYGSSILMAMNGLLFLIANVLSAVIGSHCSGIRVRSYFRPFDAEKFQLVKYVFIGIFIQAATGIIYTLVSTFMSSMGVEDFVADIDTYVSAKSIIATGLYTCIVAPVTEELLYRGFVLKNLSRVSQHFGIIASAALFGLAHENLAQFLLAMPVGIFMARIVIRHNSLIPSILVHIGVNTIAFGLNWVYTAFPPEGAYSILVFFVDVLYYLIAGGGLVFWIMEVRKSRLPANTIRQSYRGIRILLTSPWLIAIAVLHFSMALINIASQNL